MKRLQAVLTGFPQLEKCTACGNCLCVCPSYKISRDEPNSPRGRLHLGLALAKRAIQPGEILDAFRHCLHCGKCQLACPLQLPLQPFFLAVTASLEPFYSIPRRVKLLERILLAYPSFASFIHPPVAMAISLSRRLGRPMQKDLPALPATPFTAPRWEKTEKSKKNRAILFTGCITRYLMPELAQAGLDLIEKTGLEVLAPRDLGCCGRPQLMRGASILTAVRRTLKILDNVEYKFVLTPCPGCLATLRDVWPDLPGLNKEERQKASALARSTRDLSSYLARHISLDSADESGKIFWHRPCLQTEEDNVAIMTILATTGGEPITGGPDDCCGAPLRCSDMRMSLRKSSDRSSPASRLAISITSAALASGAKQLLTACPGCVIALRAGFERVHRHLPVRHLVSYIKERLTSGSPTERK